MKKRPSPTAEIEQLVQALRGQDPEKRHARVSLQHDPCPAFIPHLLVTAKDADTYIRASAVYALAGYMAEASPQLLEALFSTLADDPDPSVRSAAAEVLACRSSTSVLNALLAALGDASVDVRGNVVLALGGYGADAAVTALKDRMHRDPSPEVRRHAVLALERLMRHSQGENSIDDLILALKDESEDVRGAIVRALGEYPAVEGEEIPAIMNALVQALSDASSYVREGAARALAYSSSEAIPGLMALLDDEDAGVRQEAVRALGTVDAYPAIDTW